MNDKERVISFCLRQIEECCEIIATLTKEKPENKWHLIDPSEKYRVETQVTPTFYTKTEGGEAAAWFHGPVNYVTLTNLRSPTSVVINGVAVHSLYFNVEGEESIRWDCISGFTDGIDRIGLKLEKDT